MWILEAEQIFKMYGLSRPSLAELPIYIYIYMVLVIKLLPGTAAYIYELDCDVLYYDEIDAKRKL